MRISRIQSFLLSYVFPEPIRLTYHGGQRTILKRDAMLIRVEADNGLVGYAPGQGSEKAHQSIENVIAPFLKGHVLADPDALRIHFERGPGADAELMKVYSAVEIALYDLLGKEKGAPVSELLGGRVRDRIRLYGSAGMYMTPERYAEEAMAIAALGFNAYKMRAGNGPEKDVETVRQMRQAVGPDIDLMIDAHTWWRMGDSSYLRSTVEQIAKELSNYHIAWLEEPLAPDDHEAYRHLKALDYVPLASGEHEPDELRYLDLIQTDCVDYVQADVICQGGYPVARRLFAEIGREGLRFAFHSWGTALEVIAAAHVGICWPETIVEWLEYPCYSTSSKPGMYPFPLAAEILKDPLQIDHGQLTVPQSPGLGVAVDERVIERYPWVPGPWSYFQLDSPTGTWAVTADHSQKWSTGAP
ncbi:MAG TPA: mandelate racemase/muconate lactonizing enzyme family protein [Bryobacteraceae bacterium]|nr:mandelate racemase/muconate lactonizing enzyme family protein [Bryobacteraceae bacterium]